MQGVFFVAACASVLAVALILALVVYLIFIRPMRRGGRRRYGYSGPRRGGGYKGRRR